MSKATHHLVSLLMVAIFAANQLLPIWWPPQPYRVAAPPPPVAADAPASGVVAAPSPPTSARGTLHFAPTVDLDGQPQTNPLAGTPVPVMRYGNAAHAEPVLFGTIRLAAELRPLHAQDNPAGTPVTFHLWDERGKVTSEVVPADEWGAAQVEWSFNDLYLDRRYSYSVEAPGFGNAGRRAFRFETTRYIYDVRLGALSVSASTADNGLTTFEISSELPIPERLGAVTLEVVRATPIPGSDRPQLAVLPALVAERVDAFRARAQLFLEAGDYMVQANVAHDAQTDAQSLPLLHKVALFDHPPIALVEEIAAGDGTNAWVKYRTADGNSAFIWQALAAIPPEAFPVEELTTPNAFVEQTRIGPFEYRTDVFNVTTQVLSDDGKKYAVLSDFRYDPLANSFDIEVHSKLDQPIDDRMTVEVFGPHGVVIHTEEWPVHLDPAAPFRQHIVVPADAGQPTGVRITVHDPFIISFDILFVPVFLAVEAAASSIFDTLVGLIEPSGQNAEGFNVTLSFKVQLKLLSLKLFEKALNCAAMSGCVFQDAKGLFFNKTFEAVVVQVTADVRDYLRSRFKIPADIADVPSMLKIVAAGIPAGSLEFTVGLSLQYTKTIFDPARCTSQQEFEAAKLYVDSIAKALDESTKFVTHQVNIAFKPLIPQAPKKPLFELPIPGLSFLTLAIKPLLAFKLEGNKPNDFQVFLRLGPAEVGIGGELVLKVPAIDLLYLLFKRVEDVQNLLKAARATLERYKLLESAVRLVYYANYNGKGYCGGAPRTGSSSGGASGGGGRRGGTPALNGHPDDRLDAFQTVDARLPAGTVGDIHRLHALLEAADRRNFELAAVYFRKLLAQAELTTFTLDAQSAVSRTLEIDATTAATELRMSGLLSGTILPEPGDTITDAIFATYETFLTDIANTSIDRREAQLAAAVAFAEVNYQQLRGQELELQYELRQLAQVDGVGIVDAGYAASAYGAIGSFGVRAVPVQLVAGDSVIRNDDSRYYAPHEAPRVLIVPSGGLYRYAGNEQVKRWLDAYVTLGGTLLVLAQAEAADFELLPGGLQGLGYTEDIFCQVASVEINNSAIWLAGVRRNRPDLQLDGSFLVWPANATILLTRTTGNQKPAMIEYPYGLGRVVAMALYPDFYMNGLQSAEDLAFARSLFTYAGLLATEQTAAGPYPINTTPSVAISVTNTTPFTATQMTVFRDYYTNSIGDSWRWAFHRPANLQLPTAVPIDPPLPPGQQRTVLVNVPMPTVGFGRLGYILTGSDRLHFGAVQPSRFYQVLSPLVPTDLVNFHLQTDRLTYPFGATVTATVRIQNDRSSDRTFQIAPLDGVSFAPATVTVAAQTVATLTATTVADRTRDLRVRIDEAGATVTTLVAPLRLTPPQTGLSTHVAELTALTTATVTATLTTRFMPPGSNVAWRVLQDGSEIYTATTPLAPAGVYLQAVITPTLPAAPAGTTFEFEATTAADGATLRTTLTAYAPARIVSASRVGTAALGTRADGAIFVRMQGGAQPAVADLHVRLLNGFNVLTETQPLSATIAAGAAQLVLLDLPLPNRIFPGSSYTIEISGTVQTAGGGPLIAINPLALELPTAPPALSLAERRLTTADTLELTLDMPPGVPTLKSGEAVTLTLYDADFNFRQYTVTDTVPFGNDLLVSLPLDDELASGRYNVYVAAAQLEFWSDGTTFDIPDPAITYALSPTASAGDSLTLTLTNLGGEGVTLTGTLTLVRDSRTFLTLPANVDLPLGSAADISLTLPTQLASGGYTLRWSARDEYDRPYATALRVIVSGISATLNTATDAPLYLPPDAIGTTSVITAGAPLSAGQLRLRLIKPGSAPAGWDGWLDAAASSGNRNAIGQPATPPFGLTWTADLFNALPVAANDHVYAADDDGIVYAFNSADGSIAWQTPVSASAAYITDIALNATTLVAAFSTANPSRSSNATQPLAAFNPVSGALLWETTAEGNDLWLSDDALVTTHNFGNSYAVRDLLDGSISHVITPTNYSYTTLLVANLLLFHEGNSIAAWDTGTGALVWAVATGGQLTAADAVSVIAIDNGFDLATFTTVYTLTQYDTASGALLASWPLNDQPHYEDVALLGDNFYYVGSFSDGGGSTRAPNDEQRLYRVDLLDGSHSQLATFSDYSFRLAVTGDLVQLLLPDMARLRTIDGDGNELAALDLSSFGYLSDIAVSGSGLLLGQVNNYGNYTLHAFNAAQPVGGGLVVGSVLREAWLPVGGSGTFTLTDSFADPAPGADPLARGNLYLEATLFGAQPAAAAPAERQPLAQAYAPFAIAEADADLLLQAGQPLVRLNRPTLAADDAASRVVLTGLVRNATPVTSDVIITVTRHDGAPIGMSTLTAVPADDTRTFSMLDTAPPVGPVTYTLTSSLGGSVTATAQIVPVNVAASARWLPTVVDVGTPAELLLTLTNSGPLAAFVTADLGDGAAVVPLAGGSTLQLTRSLTPTVTGTFTQPVTLAGDIANGAGLLLAPPLRVVDRGVAATLAVTGTLRASGGLERSSAPQLVAGSDAQLLLTLTNPQTETQEIVISWALSGDATRTVGQTATAFPGENQFWLALAELTAGNFSAVVHVHSAADGRLLGSATLDFAVVAPIYDLSVALAGALQPGGDLRLTVTALSGAAGERNWGGQLIVTDNGDLLYEGPLSLTPTFSQSLTLFLPWAARTGVQTFAAALVDASGLNVAETILAVPATLRVAPQVTLAALTATPATAGGTTRLSVTFDNAGVAGDVTLLLNAFDTTLETQVAVPGAAVTVVHFDVPVPGDLIGGTYRADVRLADGQQASTDVAVSGPELALAHALDARAYLPDTAATWTVTVTGVSGTPAPYDVELRYRGAVYSTTVTIGGGDTAVLTWPFGVGRTTDFAHVVVAGHRSDPAQPRRSLLIDSERVAIIENPSGYITTQRARYDAGETVHGVYHANGAAVALVLWRDLPGDTEPVVWATHMLSGTAALSATQVVGSFPFSTTLPATLPSGRYHLALFQDGTQSDLPIDVHGIDLLTEQFSISTGTGGGRAINSVPLTLRATLRAAQALPQVVVRALAVAPDDTLLTLGGTSVLTLPLAIGVTPLELTVTLPVMLPDAYKIVLRVEDGNGTLIGGEVGWVDIGRGWVSALTTEHAIYAPLAAGVGTVIVYGSGTPIDVLVTTSDLTPLLSTVVTPTGFASYTFTVPTATPGDEVLIASVADGDGFTSTLQRAYKVADTFDTTAPRLTVTSPPTGTVVPGSSDQYTVTVTGIVSDDIAVGAVYVGGMTATLTTRSSTAIWQIGVPLTPGNNVLDIVAHDAAGNVGETTLLDVVAEPSYGVTLAINQNTPQIDEPITFQAVVTSDGTLDATLLFPFSVQGLAPFSGSASSGALDIDNLPVSWTGIVSPGVPITVTWRATGTVPLSRTVSAIVYGEGMLGQVSNAVPLVVEDNDPTAVVVQTLLAWRPWTNGLVVAWFVLLGLTVWRRRRRAVRL